MNNTTHLETVLLPDTVIGIRVVYIVFLLGIHLIGVPGNVVSAIIYKRKSPKSACDWLIFTMSITDALACLFSPILFLKVEIRFFSIAKWNILCNLEHWFQFATMFASCIILVVIAVDRYVKVCHPHARSLTPHMARNLSLLCVVISGSVPIFPFFYKAGSMNCHVTAHEVPEEVKIYGVIIFFTFIFSVLVVVFAYVSVCKQLSYKNKLKQRLKENLGLGSAPDNALIKGEATCISYTLRHFAAFRWREVTRRVPDAGNKKLEIRQTICYTELSDNEANDKEREDTGVNSLTTGGSSLNTGGNSLNTGVNSLNTGVNSLNTGGNSLNTGVNSLNTGVNSLNTGVCGSAGASLIKPLGEHVVVGIETFYLNVSEPRRYNSVSLSSIKCNSRWPQSPRSTQVSARTEKLQDAAPPRMRRFSCPDQMLGPGACSIPLECAISGRSPHQRIHNQPKQKLDFVPKNCRYHCNKSGSTFSMKTPVFSIFPPQDLTSPLCSSHPELAGNDMQNIRNLVVPGKYKHFDNEHNLRDSHSNTGRSVCGFSWSNPEIISPRNADPTSWCWPRPGLPQLPAVGHLHPAITRSTSTDNFELCPNRSSSILEICDGLLSSPSKTDSGQARIYANQCPQGRLSKSALNSNSCSRSQSGFREIQTSKGYLVPPRWNRNQSDFRVSPTSKNYLAPPSRSRNSLRQSDLIESQISKTDFVAPPSCIPGIEISWVSDGAGAPHKWSHADCECSVKGTIEVSKDAPRECSQADSECYVKGTIEASKDANSGLSSFDKCCGQDGARDLGSCSSSIARWKRSSGKRLTRERQVTLMLVSVTAVFLLSWFPAWLIWVARYYLPPDRVTNMVAIYLGRISLINCAASPVIYFNFNPSYRSKVKELLRPLFRYFLCKKKE